MSLVKLQIVKGFFWLLITVYNEARGESAEGQKGVTKVILNRADKNGWPIENIVKARKQFSCFNDGIDATFKEPAAAAEVAKNVYDAIDEWLNGDRLDGATHYYAPAGMKDGKPPAWIKDMQFIGCIGNHIFFREA